MDKTNNRSGFLDFLKFIFAIIIVIGHGDKICGTEMQNRLIPLASFGVEFFFIVSGAMMMRSSEKKKQDKSLSEDTLHFIRHKIEGLLPNYYIAWFILFVMQNQRNSFRSVIFGFFRSIPELLFLKMSGMPTQSYNGNTWYISAMMLSLFILYPLLRKNRSFYIKYIAPFISVFGIAYIIHNYKSILVIEEWNGFFYMGLLRGIADICIGCISYELSKKLRRITFTKNGKRILTILETVLYLGVIVMLFSFEFRFDCYVLLFVLMTSVCITLSGVSYSNTIFNHSCFHWMGKYSYSLYLGHSIAYSGIIGKIIFESAFSYTIIMTCYIICALLSGLVVMYLSKLYSWVWHRIKPQIIKTLIIDK